MNFSIVVPKRKINKAKKSGGGSDFWKNFWEKEITDDNRDYYTKRFTKRVNNINTVVSQIKQRIKNPNKLVYIEIELDKLARSKSSSPNEVWNQTGLEIVSAIDDQTIIVSGKQDGLDRLSSISKSGSFNSALTGEGLERRKDKNLLRELYAMSIIKDRSNLVEGRISSYISSFDESDTVIDCIIEIYSNVTKNKYDEIFNIFNKSSILKGRIKKRNINLFFNNISFLATITKDEAFSLLSDPGFDFIRKIKEEPILNSQRCVPKMTSDKFNILQPQTKEKVGLIDGGIHNPTLQKCRVHYHNYLEDNHNVDKNHGAIVASRILFGDKFFSSLENDQSLLPVCSIVDIQVLYLEGDYSKCIKCDDLETAIIEVIKRNKDISIYNLSINEIHPIVKDEVSELTSFLDHIARLYDVIFVCSVGNQFVYTFSQNYNNIFERDESIIASPSDALNVISVGAISKKVAPDCINNEQGFPSPFTRTSGVQRDIKKPELVANGGNIKRSIEGIYGPDHMMVSNNLFGVEGINKNGLYRDAGTSFSTPLITRECVFLLDFIKKTQASEYIDLTNNKLNLVKALLIHSTAKVSQVKIKDDFVKRAYGFGVPDHKPVLKDEKNELTLVYADKVDTINKRHKLQIQLPEDLLEKEVELIFTLTYNPPVDRNYPKIYKMMTIKPALRLIVPSIQEDGSIKDEPISLNQPSTWDRYRNENHNVIHFKRIVKKMRSSVLEVFLQLLVAQAYEGKERDESQSYAFVLTVRDLSGYENFREELISANEFQELIQIEAEEEIQI